MKILFILGTVIYILTGNVVLQYFLLGVGLYLLIEWLLVSLILFTATLLKIREKGSTEVLNKWETFYKSKEDLKTEIRNYLNVWTWL